MSENLDSPVLLNSYKKIQAWEKDNQLYLRSLFNLPINLFAYVKLQIRGFW